MTCPSAISSGPEWPFRGSLQAPHETTSPHWHSGQSHLPASTSNFCASFRGQPVNAYSVTPDHLRPPSRICTVGHCLILVLVLLVSASPTFAQAQNQTLSQ